MALYAMHSIHILFSTRHISETAEMGIYSVGTKNRKLCLLSNGAILVTLDNPHTSIPFFIARRYAGAVYIVLWPCVRPSVRLVKGRGTARRQVATSSSMRPIATDAQQWRGLLLLRLYGNNRVASVYALPCISSFNSIVIRFQ